MVKQTTWLEEKRNLIRIERVARAKAKALNQTPDNWRLHVIDAIEFIAMFDALVAADVELDRN